MRKDIPFSEEKYKEYIKSAFQELRDKWRDETSIHSSVSLIYGNTHYKQIINLGPEIIPLIFEDMTSDKPSGFWFGALEALTGYKMEYPDDEIGKIALMNQRWINWGRQNGYIK